MLAEIYCVQGNGIFRRWKANVIFCMHIFEFQGKIQCTQFNVSARKYEHATSLSTYIWKLKDAGTDYKIKWELVEGARSFQPGSRYCPLCVAEKKWIIMADRRGTLNKNNELFGKCRHKSRFLLENLEDDGRDESDAKEHVWQNLVDEEGNRIDCDLINDTISVVISSAAEANIRRNDAVVYETSDILDSNARGDVEIFFPTKLILMLREV